MFEIAQLAVQAIGVAAVVLTLYVYHRQLRTMERQRVALEREIAARMRPWVGLFDFGLRGSSPAGDEALKVVLRNCGALPAQNARLSLVLRPSPTRDGEPDERDHWEESGTKALVPGEEGNYTIPLARFPHFLLWRESRRDVVVAGNMVYALGEESFRTELRVLSVTATTRIRVVQSRRVGATAPSCELCVSSTWTRRLTRLAAVGGGCDRKPPRLKPVR